MAIEDDHLAQLRAGLAALQGSGGDDGAVRAAVEVLLKVAIAHHESVGLGVAAEVTPPFMEAGEPIAEPAFEGPAR